MDTNINPGTHMTTERKGHVALLHNGRGGSTVLMNLLMQSPGIVSGPEPFLGYFGEYRERMRGLGKFVDYPWSRSVHHPHAPLEYLRERLPAPPARHVTSIKLYHLRGIDLSFERFLNAIPELGYTHVIFLNRANYLRKIVSCLVAEAKVAQGHQEAYFNPTGTPSQKLTIRLDVDDVEVDSAKRPLCEYFAEWDEDVAEIRELLRDRSHLELEYARHVREDPRTACVAARAYLGVEQTPLSVNLSPTNPFALEHILENYDEVAAHLAGTPWSWMLEAD
jgi:hypothetical protein